MSELQKGSMREHLNNIYMRCVHDLDLLRLLYYKTAKDNPDRLTPLERPLLHDEDGNPLDWDIVDKHIFTVDKSSKIEKDAICRIYIYPGRRRPIFGNYMVVKQEVIIDVLVHDSYAGDLRIEWIGDKLNEILCLKPTGYSKLDYAAGDPRDAPTGYSKFQHRFLFGDSKG